MESRIVGIIGINGKFGRWLKRFFEEQGCTVIGSDVDTPMTNRQVVEQAEVVVFAVTLRFTTQVILGLIKFSRSEQLWMDITSLKSPAINAMLQSQANVVGLHPMCAPPAAQTLRGQTLVYCPVRLAECWQGWVQDFLLVTQAKIKESIATQHDRYMAIVQAAPHAVILAMASMIRKLGIDIGESLEYTSPFYRLVFSLMGRILGQDPNLYAGIQMENIHVNDVVPHVYAALRDLTQIVGRRDYEQFSSEFLASRAYFGTSVGEASLFFDAMIGLLADLSDENMIVLLASEDRPGLLHELTGILSELGVNLTSFHSKRIGEGKYKFLVGVDKRKDSPEIIKARELIELAGFEIVS